MFKAIQTWVLKQLFVYSFRTLEKQNLVTKALKSCYKTPKLKPVWGVFVDSVISFFEDCISEAKEARKW